MMQIIHNKIGFNMACIACFSYPYDTNSSYNTSLSQILLSVATTR